MAINATIKAALNKIGISLPELSKGYNSLLANVQLGDVIEAEAAAAVVDAGSANTATLANATSTVVTDTSVQAGDKIFIEFTEALGAALTVVFVDTIVAGVSFKINHSIAAGTEIVNYHIER